MGIFRRHKQHAAIDLRDQPALDLREEPTAGEAAGAKWGFPTRCPECGDFGYLDRIDVVREVMYQHCPTCWARWETPRSATVADA